MKTKVAVVLCAATLATGAEGAEERTRRQTLRSPELYYLDHYDESRPLRDMPVIRPREGDRRIHAVKLLHPPREIAKAFKDPLAAPSLAPSPLVAVTAGLNFDGIGVGLGNFSPSSAPPDTNGAVGSTQYVQWVNTSFAVFNKSTGALVFGPAAGDTLWQGFGGACEANNDGDPIAIYDKKANRWLMTQFSVSGGQFFQCVAVSTSADATGSYRRFAYQFTNFNDYPKAGVWPDGYYISFNMFNAAGTAFVGARACVLDRIRMITAADTPGPIQCFQLSSSFGGLLPSDQDGATNPPAGAPNYFVAFGTNVLQLWKYHVNWATPANSTFTGPTNISVAAFSEACGGGRCIPQPSTTQQLDSLADRLMYRLAYRNFGTHESLVTNHSVTAGSAASGVRWYEVRSPNGTPAVFQQGTFAPDATSRWMGSIAMDQQGNMLLGYSASSGSVRPSVRITGRAVSDALGTMQSETTVQAGVGSQTGNLSRWGDYSAMTVDPVDDCTFWFTTEYLKASGSFNWSTRITSRKFPSCGATPPPPDFAVSCSPSSLSVRQGASGNSTCTVTSANGFASAVSLSCTGLPTGASCSFSPASVTPPANGSATSSLTLSLAASTATGTYPLQVRGTSGSTVRSSAVSLTVTSAAVFSDDFETDKGWVRNPSGTDTATTGLWERGDPEATDFSGAKQLGTTVSGVNDLVTARLAGASVGANDVDGGVTSIQSPAIALPATGTLTLSLQYYLAHANNSSSADFFRVFVVAGATSTKVFESLGAATNRNGAWTPVSVPLSSFAGQTIRLRFEAADASTASLVEAGVDDVKVTQQ